MIVPAFTFDGDAGTGVSDSIFGNPRDSAEVGSCADKAVAVVNTHAKAAQAAPLIAAGVVA